MAKKYQHASFLKNVSGMPKYWFIHKKTNINNPQKDQPVYFYNLKDNKDLIITDGLTGVYHVIYNGGGLEVFDTYPQALSYAKKYMRNH